MNTIIIIISVIVVAVIALMIILSSLKGYCGKILNRVGELKSLIKKLQEDIQITTERFEFVPIDDERLARSMFELAEEGSVEELEHYTTDIGLLTGLDINDMRNKDNETFGHVAVRLENKELLQWFLECGGRTDIRCGSGGKSVDRILESDTEVEMSEIIKEHQQQ